MMRFVPSTDHALFLFDLVLSVTLHALMASAVVSLSAPGANPPPLEQQTAQARLNSVQVVWMDEVPEELPPPSAPAAPVLPPAPAALPSSQRPEPTPLPPTAPRKPATPMAMAPVPVPVQAPLQIEDAVLAGQHASLPKEVLEHPAPLTRTGNTERDALHALPQWGLPFGTLSTEGDPLSDGMSVPKTAEADDSSSEAPKAGSEVGTGGNTPQLLFETGRLEPLAADGSDPGLLSDSRAGLRQKPLAPRDAPPVNAASEAKPAVPRPPPPAAQSQAPQEQPAQAAAPGKEAPDAGLAETTAGRQKQLKESMSLPAPAPPPGNRGEVARRPSSPRASPARNAGSDIKVPPESPQSPLTAGVSGEARAAQAPAVPASPESRTERRLEPTQARAVAKTASDTPQAVAKLPPAATQPFPPPKDPVKDPQKTDLHQKDHGKTDRTNGADQGLEKGIENAPEAPTVTRGAPRSSIPPAAEALEPPSHQAAPRIEVTPPSLLQQLMARVVSRMVGARNHGTPSGGQLPSPQAGRLGIDHQGSGTPPKPTQGDGDLSAAGGQTAKATDSNSIGTIITAQSPYWEYGVQVQSRITQEFNRAGADAREALSLTGRVTLLITLEKDGRVSGYTVTNGKDLLDQTRLAQAALARCRRFPPIPDAYGVERLRFAATFDFGK